MRHYTLLLIGILNICVLTPSQAQFFNDFSTDQLSEWSGDNIEFFIFNETLKLRAPAAGSSILYRDIEIQDSTRFQIDINLEFSPSSSNALLVYLYTEDIANPEKSAYYLKVGESGSNDAFELIKVIDGNSQVIGRFTDGSMSSDPAYASLEINRYPDGIWHIYSSYSTSSSRTLESQLIENDPFNITQGFFAIECKYTASRRNNFNFDNIGVTKIVPDTEPPFVNSLQVINHNTIKVNYNETLDSTTAIQNQHYNISDHPIETVTIDDSKHVITITTTEPFEEGRQQELSITNVSDAVGNLIRDTVINFTFYDLKEPSFKDLIFTEVLAKPEQSNVVNREFVEIYNNSEHYISSEGMVLSDRSTSGMLKSERIDPHSFVILCSSANSDYFKNFGQVIEVNPWPSLNNTTDSLTLYHSQSNVISDILEYSNVWYSQTGFYTSGYSLELHNLEGLCYFNGEAWWEHESDEFASPGRQNVGWNNTLNLNPEILRIEIVNPQKLIIHVNHILSSQASGNIEIESGNINIDSIKISGNQIIVLFDEEMVDGEVYQGVLSGVDDCANNNSFDRQEFSFALPEEENSKNICITEVMFDPDTGSPQWVELYNGSDDYYDVSDLYLDIYKSEVRYRHSIGNSNLFYPDSLMVVSSDCSQMSKIFQVPSLNCIELPNLTSLDRDYGHITISDNSYTIDSITYDENWHDLLLSETKGVSIARISCESSGINNHSWYSSPASIGFSSPTKRNFIDLDSKESESALTLITPTVSPDGDGYEDQLIIVNNVDRPNIRSRMDIYDIRGSKIYTVKNNYSMAVQDIITWSGIDKKGNKIPVGLYLIKVELFDENGFRETWKTSFSIVR